MLGVQLTSDGHQAFVQPEHADPTEGLEVAIRPSTGSGPDQPLLNELIADSVARHVVHFLANPFDMVAPPAVELFGRQVFGLVGGHAEMLAREDAFDQLWVASAPSCLYGSRSELHTDTLSW